MCKQILMERHIINNHANHLLFLVCGRERGDDDRWGYITKHVRELFQRIGVGVSKSIAYKPYRTSSMQSKLSSR